MRHQRKFITALLAAALVVGQCMAPGVTAPAGTDGTASAEIVRELNVGDTELAQAATDDDVEPTIGPNVATHTKEEILDYMDSHPTSADDEVTYAKEPITAGGTYTLDSVGVLSDETQQSALNMINQMRYIAGLDEVSLDSDYSEKASAATLLNYLNDEMSHYPERPYGADDDLYNLGYSAASSSNLAWNYHNLNDSIIRGWMSDGDSSNITTVGHRRWVLNPTMGKIGFGVTVNYYAMYAHDMSASSASQTMVAWPAQTMPVQYFCQGDPWSISVGESVTESDIKVILVRNSDNATWTFTSDSADGAFYVNNEYYAQTGCIIFQPDNLTISPGDIFTVAIEGAASSTISYNVEFFDADGDDGTGDGSDTNDGSDTGKNDDADDNTDDNTNNNSGRDVIKVGYTTTIDGATYKVTSAKDLTVEHMGYDGASGAIMIPATVKIDGTTYTVTAIADGAFSGNKNITSVAIGKNVTIIGRQAFKGCKRLKTVTLGASVKTIKAGAFQGCKKLTAITLKARVKKIGENAFKNCEKLMAVNIKSEKLTAVGMNAFSGISDSARIKVPFAEFLKYTAAFRVSGYMGKVEAT